MPKRARATKMVARIQIIQTVEVILDTTDLNLDEFADGCDHLGINVEAVKNDKELTVEHSLTFHDLEYKTGDSHKFMTPITFQNRYFDY